VNRSLDRIDRELLALLKANAREPVASLARKLELSRSAIQDRIGRLEREGVIAGYTVRLGSELPGNRLQAIVRFTMDPKHTPEVVRELRRIPEAEACYSVSGAFDLIVMVSAETAVRLHQVLQAFGEMRGVERTTSSIVLVTEFDHR
jgi:DNA-binding Lrp family transcriptional regulator